MKEVLSDEQIRRFKDEHKIDSDYLIKIIEAKDFDFSTVNFTGTVPESRAFQIFVMRPPVRMSADKKFFGC